MEVAALKIQIQSEVTAAVAGLKQTEAALNNVAAAAPKAAQGLNTINGGFEAVSKQANNTASAGRSAMRQLVGSITSVISPTALLAAAVISIGKAIYDLAFSESEAEKNFNRLSQVVTNSGKSFVEAATSVETLRTQIEQAKNGFIAKENVVHQFNETIGKTVGKVQTLEQAERSLNENAATFIKFQLAKAAANQALEASGTAAFESLKLSLAYEEARRRNLPDLVLKEIEKKRQDALKEIDAYKNIALGFINVQNNVAKDFQKSLKGSVSVESPEKGEIKVPKIKDVKVPKITIKPDKIEVEPSGVGNTDLFQKKPKITITVPVAFDPDIQSMQDAMDVLVDENNRRLQELYDNNLAFTENFRDTVLGVFEAFATSFGSKNPIKTFFGSSLSLVGDFLIQLGKAAIAASAVGTALKKILVSPQLGFVAGLAAIAIGGIIKSAVPKFAAGGGVTGGPQLSLIGDNPSGKEAVIPFERLGEFARAAGSFNTGGGTLEARISGNDLLFLLNRTGRGNIRQFGFN